MVNLHESQIVLGGAFPGLSQHAVDYTITERAEPKAHFSFGEPRSAEFRVITHGGGPDRTLQVNGYDEIVAVIETLDKHEVLAADQRHIEENGFERGKYKSEEELQGLIDDNHQSFPPAIQP